ncbi:1-(5-phosphoribosyl)-5-[(5-phosphoribosylamino) methylideneamino] imidazole-4-carboxamide isomerase [Striga asiatica]|uniref:1-(5-phosphoribosyl)-5-[(5-phosphoribosylamino) methylideneamino] imidazole-4-carboxamide isomerase n=1 Tax=Striga asiatica TaxID=4170 RepID=A0A5A7PS02_STRAF|nr:1-(5-phosphoribosyl)-5-[(5-phosphoribosylamino) methylideneamino] imidazole-4-carboxamide isomerase [Striga asiatica]
MLPLVFCFQLTDLCGSWSEFIDYVTTSLKAGDVKLIMECSSKSGGVDYAKLVAQKAKGMPRVSFSLSKLVDGASGEAMAYIALELYKEYNDVKSLLVEEQECKYQLTKVVAAEREKNSDLQKQLDMVLHSTKYKSQKINDREISDSASVMVSQDSPDKRAAQEPSSRKGSKRVVPAHRSYGIGSAGAWKLEIICFIVLKLWYWFSWCMEAGNSALQLPVKCDFQCVLLWHSSLCFATSQARSSLDLSIVIFFHKSSTLVAVLVMVLFSLEDHQARAMIFHQSLFARLLDPSDVWLWPEQILESFLVLVFLLKLRDSGKNNFTSESSYEDSGMSLTMSIISFLPFGSKAEFSCLMSLGFVRGQNGGEKSPNWSWRCFGTSKFSPSPSGSV